MIKVYRKKLGKKYFNKISDYANDFIKFLNNSPFLFSESEQKKYFYQCLISIFHMIKKEIEKNINVLIKNNNTITESEIKKYISDSVNNHFKNISSKEDLKNVPKNHSTNIRRKYKSIFEKAIKDCFEKLPLDIKIKNKLIKIGTFLFTKNIFSDSLSGLVIAGFGEKEIFPVVNSFEIEGVIANKLKYIKKLDSKIDHDNSASIIPFAQKEMVHSFMEGIDPYLQYTLDGFLHEIFKKFPELITNNLKGLSNKDKDNFKKNIEKATSQILNNFNKQFINCKSERFIQPVVKVVSMLPKDELAAMAEALINLTSFKRKISMDSETVGGPIDVAVISKGDGFIWISRKHYFSPELNHQFFKTYFTEVLNEKENK